MKTRSERNVFHFSLCITTTIGRVTSFPINKLQHQQLHLEPKKTKNPLSFPHHTARCSHTPHFYTPNSTRGSCTYIYGQLRKFHETDVRYVWFIRSQSEGDHLCWQTGSLHPQLLPPTLIPYVLMTIVSKIRCSSLWSRMTPPHHV